MADNMDEDEVRYLSSTTVTNKFGGEDLCERADIHRRNGYKESTLPLNEYNHGFVEMMVKKDSNESTNKNMGEYEMESLLQSVMENKEFGSIYSSSSDHKSDDSIEELFEESEIADKWTPNVFKRPNEEEFAERFHSIMDFDDSLHSCLSFKTIEAQPYESVQKALSFYKSFLDRLKQINALNIRLELYLWPSIMKNISITCISGPKSGKTNSYLVPLMNWFDSKEVKDNKNDAIIGAIVVCSSTRQTYDIARLAKYWRDPNVPQMEQTIRIVSMNSTNEKRQMTAILNGCDILISTPGPLLRAMESSIIDSSKTRCLIIDEADLTLALHKDAVLDIYLSYARMKKTVKRFIQKNGTVSNPLAFQTMVFAQKLTEEVKWFSKEIQHLPSVFFGSFYETSIAFKVESRVEVIESEKYREKAVQNVTKDVIQWLTKEEIKSKYKRIAIVCRNEDEIRFLRRHLRTEISSNVVLEVSENMADFHFDLDAKREKWNSYSGLLLLLITDGAIKQVEGFQTCRCIIHYKLPNNFETDFGRRFFLMRKRFQKVKNPITVNTFPKLISYVVVSPIDSHIPELITYLNRVGAVIPQNLISHCNYERRPLCVNFASFAKCPLGPPFCSDRHKFSSNDCPLPELPMNGQIMIVISYVMGANQFYFRLQAYRNESQTSGEWQKSDITYDDMRPQLNLLKDSPFNTIKNVDFQEVYGISIRGEVLRVRIVRLVGDAELQYYEEYDPNDKNQKIELFCIDFGHKLRSRMRQLFELPQNLRDLPPMAYKGYLFGIKPIDNEIEWDFRSTQKFYNLVDNYRIAKITAWVLKQIDGVFWLNQLNVKNKLMNASMKLDIYPAQMLIQHKIAEKNEFTLPNVNTDYHKIVNIWHNHRLNSSAYNSCLVDDSTYVVVTDFVSLKHFYVMHESRVKRLEELEDKWLTFLPSLEPLTEVIENQFCFYRGRDGFTKEEYLNRAKVVDVSGDTTYLFLVDRGETIKTVDKQNLFRIAESQLRELPFQAIKVSLFGVEAIKDITYNEFCELTRNDQEQYLMSIAEKVSYDNGVHTIRLFVAQNDCETHFVSLSKLLVDNNYAKYVDKEEDNELEFTVNKEIEDPNEEPEPEYIEELDRYMLDNMVKAYLQQSLGVDINDFTPQLTDKSSEPTTESLASKTRRRLRAIKAKNAKKDEASDESDEEDIKPLFPKKVIPNSGDFDYELDPNAKILGYDPNDTIDENCDYSDEEGILEQEELT